MYAHDFNDFLPYGYAYTWPGQKELYWWQDLVPAVHKNEPVYSCPSAKPHGLWFDLRPPGTPKPLVKDYLCNAQGGAYPESGKSAWVDANGPFINNWQNPSRTLGEIQDTTGTIAICDGSTNVFEIWRLEQVDAWYNAGFGPRLPGQQPGQEEPEPGTHRQTSQRRLQRSFCDGHCAVRQEIYARHVDESERRLTNRE